MTPGSRGPTAGTPPRGGPGHPPGRLSTPRRGVSRPRALLGLLVLLSVLAGIVAATEALRRPGPTPPIPDVGADPGDPRETVDCPSALVGGDSTPRDRDPVPVASGDLYACPSTFDNALVTFEGEVVGAVMGRGDGAWTQLNDDAYANALGPLPGHRDYRGSNAGVGVHLPEDVAERVERVGGPTGRGDVLRVEGTFHRVDEDSGEVAVIRAASGEVVEPGAPTRQPSLPARRAAAVAAALAAVALLVGERVVRRAR